jgi:hypothetical protein
MKSGILEQFGIDASQAIPDPIVDRILEEMGITQADIDKVAVPIVRQVLAQLYLHRQAAPAAPPAAAPPAPAPGGPPPLPDLTWRPK